MTDKMITEDAITQAKREYFKEWRAKNKDKIKASNRRYWQNRAKKIKELEEDVKKEGEVIDELLNKASENK